MTFLRWLGYGWLWALLGLISYPHFAGAAQRSTTTLPFAFEKNLGQALPGAQYVLRSNSIDARFLPNQVVLELPTASRGALNLEMRFIDANPAPEISGVAALPGKSNYLIGADPSRWLRGVPNYAQVLYKDLYPGINVLFYGNGGLLEHDFRVSPGSEPARIAFRLSGAKSIDLSTGGDLAVNLPDGKVLLRKPVAYQQSSSGRTEVEANYVIASNGTISFKLGNFDRQRELVIDPVLTFATYLSTFAEYANLIATDSSGNSYVSGVAAFGYPVTSGAFAGCASCTTNTEVTYVSKLSPDGKSLIYSTVLGGNNYSQPTGMAVDGKGNALVTGSTGATDFPTKPAQPIAASNNNSGFLFSLSEDGSSLNYGILLGSTGSAIAVDNSGNAYLTGVAANGFSTTPGALNQGGGGDFGNNFNVFLTKYSPAGTLLYGAVLGAADPQNGGGGPIGSTAIAVDGNGDVFIAGQAGTLWPISNDAYLKKISGGAPYATPFVTEVAPDAKSLIYSTFLNYAYVVTGLAVLPNGNVFVAGNNVGADYPTTANAYQQNSTNGGAAFLTELNSTGSALVYSTVIGNSSYEINGIALDPGNGDIWLAAQTSNSAFPLVAPLESIYSTPAPYYGPVSLLNQFDATGQTLQFSTFLGATAQGFASSVAVDSKHRAHVAGSAGYGLFTTPGAYLGEVPPPAGVGDTSIYGYVAVVDPTVPAPAMCVNPNGGVNFYQVTAGTSLEQQVTLTSCGALPLTITGVSLAAGVFTAPAAQNSCVQTLAVGKSCTVSVRYSPTTLETDQSTLTISSDAPIPVVVPVVGSGVVPIISVPFAPGFNYAIVGQTSAPSSIEIMDIGQAPLVLYPARTTVSGDFSIHGVGGCTTPSFACGFNIYFTPTASGTRTGTLTIASNDPVHPLISVQLHAVGYANAPVPQITALTSQLFQAGMAQQRFYVQGVGFVPSSTIQVNGVPLPTTYQNEDFLSATLPASSVPAHSYGEIPVTVVTPAPGGGTSAPYNLTEFQLLPSPVASLIYEPVSKLLFATTPASAVDNANTIIPIDPANATPGTPIPVGNDPGVLAASSDGKYLFVGLNADNTIQRIDLSTHSVDHTFSLPVDPQLGRLKVVDMHFVPGSSDVVATLSTSVGAPDGIAYFNSSGLVNWILSAPANQGEAVDVSGFVFAGNPALIYATTAYTPSASPVDFAEVTYSSAGLAYNGDACCIPVSAAPAIVGKIATDGALLYDASGLVWNPAGNGSLVREYAVGSEPLGGSVAPDLSTGKTYFLNPFGQYSQYQATTLLAFDQTSGAQTGSLSLTTANGLDNTNGTSLVRWGSNGFAFLVANQDTESTGSVLLFTSSIANSSNLSPVPINSRLSPLSIAPGSPDFTLTVTGSGFVPGSTIEWNGTPRLTAFISSTQLTATIYASDVAAASVAQVVIVNPGQGYTASGALPFTVASTAPAEAGASLSPATLAFGSLAVGVASAPQTATLSNSSSTDLNDLTIAVTGTNAGSFAQSNNCGGAVSAGTSCTVSVVFTPSAQGSQTATLTFADSAASSPQQVALVGTGAAPPTQIGLHFMPVTPCRVADTRNAPGPFGGPELAAKTPREFDIPQSACGIPSDAVAYSLNVTVAPDKTLAYLAVWPSGQAQPNVSTLNSDGRVKANAAITPAGAHGGVTVFATDATHVILDIDGYFVPSSNTLALAYFPITPCRVADTRETGLFGGPYLAAGSTRLFEITLSPCNVPQTAQAYSINVTAIPHNRLQYLTLWPTGQPQPNVSTLNSPSGAIAANAAIVPAGTFGEISLFVHDDADVILDLNGYFAQAPGGLSLYTTTPCRALDTRNSAELKASAPLITNLESGPCAPPYDAQAYVLNSTVVPSGSLPYLTLWPDGIPQPIVSTLNAGDGAITSNMAIVPTSNGSIAAFADGTTNLILDISSYFAP